MPLPSPRNPITPARGSYANLLANIGSLSEGEFCYASDQNQIYVVQGGALVAGVDALPPEFVFVSQKADFPTAVGGVITLADNVTYYITDTVDLTGDRLVGGQNTTILGASSENCRLKSTGLVGTALLSSAWTTPIRHVTFEADVALDLDATGNANQALDWYGVNFTDCGTVGLIKNYGNFVINSTAFLNSAGLTFDGTIGTIAISNTLLSGSFGNDIITFASTLEVTRRFRQIFSSVIPVGSAAVAYRVENGAIIPDEGFILIECNFTLAAGATTVVDGLGTISSSNKILAKGCVGLENTSVNGQMYMTENVTATTFGAANTFTKIAGVTTASADNAKYTHSNNRLTNDAVRARKYLIQFTLSFIGTNGIDYEFGFYDSKLGAIRAPSRIHATASSNRVENLHTTCVVEHSQGDYIEIWAANRDGTQNLTVEDLNVVITQLG